MIKYKVLLNRKLKLIRDDEIHLFSTIKDVAEYLNLDMSKSSDRVRLSCYSKHILNPEYIKQQSNQRRGKELLGDWKLERKNIYKEYEFDKLFNDYEYGWYAHHGSFGADAWCGGCYEFDKKLITQNQYIKTRSNTLNQIPKILDIKFISGSYKDVI